MVMPKKKMDLPLLPLRDVVVFPHMVIPLFVGRPESIKALEVAMKSEKRIFLVAQRDPSVDNPGHDDLYDIGCIATVLQMLRLPDGTVKVLVEGAQRARMQEFYTTKGYFAAVSELLFESGDAGDEDAQEKMRALLKYFDQFSSVTKKIQPELKRAFESIKTPGRLADSIAAHLSIQLETRQAVLETVEIKERLDKLLTIIAQELDLVDVEKSLQSRVKNQVETSQRKYYLNEKMIAIKKELDDIDDSSDEFSQLAKKIEESGMHDEAREKAEEELNKLKMMPQMSAEATVCRNYLEIMLKVPWQKETEVIADLKVAEEVLDADHYGLKKVKERILEYLAVQQRVKKMKGPILCLVGPPGVGKTSLGQSIANATGREFIRVSLGGVRDEAEIRGHRRTYIGAMPGKVIQKLSKVGTRNPLFMLDELDKMSSDFRGDPASALLEVLDSEQNMAFNDHYLEVDYDLSEVMFIATANSLNLPTPLLDRMEVIRLAGYTENEKLHIAKNYLVPRQMERTGLKKEEIRITDGAILDLVRYYTREAGVRNLDREVSKLCRKVVRKISAGKPGKASRRCKVITKRNLESYLGVKLYRYGLAGRRDQVGQVTGLAWTQVGGELLTIESQVVGGKGKTQYTGRLGDVMQESISAAMTVVRTRQEQLKIAEDFFQKNDVHVHVPEGATPKDGPSAGVGMCTALVSAITNIPVRCDVAMTGEITLRGEVLPIGGLKEKLLAALRGGIKTVIIPNDNAAELKEIPKEVTNGLEIFPVKWIDEVLEIALTEVPDHFSKLKAGRIKLQGYSDDSSASDRTH